MHLAEFKSSLSSSTPPAGLSDLLLAMWYDGRGDWNNAHTYAQDVATPDGSWVHAYLHRKEGDQSNAQYWYGKAKRRVPSATHEEEWEEITMALLSAH